MNSCNYVQTTSLESNQKMKLYSLEAFYLASSIFQIFICFILIFDLFIIFFILLKVYVDCRMSSVDTITYLQEKKIIIWESEKDLLYHFQLMTQITSG